MRNTSLLLERLYARSRTIDEKEEAKAEETPSKTEETPSKTEETPSKTEETPSKTEETPSKTEELEPEIKPPPAEAKTLKEIAAMRTLVLHIKDPTTDFLIPIYKDKKNWVVLRNKMNDENLKKIIPKFERLVMLGHGMSSGLIGWGTYMLGASYANLLEKMKYNVHIWCNADGFVKEHGLTGFYTGMFISEVREAEFMKIKATEKEVNFSNALFAQTMRKYINSDTKTMLEKVKEMYASKQNPVIIDNFKRLYYTDTPLPKPPPVVYSGYSGYGGGYGGYGEWAGSYRDWYDKDDDDMHGGGYAWNKRTYNPQGMISHTTSGDWVQDPKTGEWHQTGALDQYVGVKKDGVYDWEHMFLPFRTWTTFEEGQAVQRNGRLFAFDTTLNVVTIKTQWKSMTEPSVEESLDYDLLSNSDKNYIENLVKKVDYPKAEEIKSDPTNTKGIKNESGLYTWEHVHLPFHSWTIYNGKRMTFETGRLISFDSATVTVRTKTGDIQLDYKRLGEADKRYVDLLVKEVDDPKPAMWIKPKPQVGKETQAGYTWEDVYLPNRMWKWYDRGSERVVASARLLSYNMKIRVLLVRPQLATQPKAINYDDMAVADKQYVDNLIDDIIAQDLEAEKTPNENQTKLQLWSPEKKEFETPEPEGKLPLIHDEMTEEEVDKIAAQYTRQKRIQSARDLEAARRANETPAERADREKEEREIRKDQQAEDAVKRITKDTPEAQRYAAIEYLNRRLSRRKRRKFLDTVSKNYREKKILGFSQQHDTPVTPPLPKPKLRLKAPGSIPPTVSNRSDWKNQLDKWKLKEPF